MPHWLNKPADEPPMTRQTQQLVFLESFLGNFLFSICMLYGVSLTSAVSAGVIMAAIPAVVALLSWAVPARAHQPARLGCGRLRRVRHRTAFAIKTELLRTSARR